MGLFRNLPAGGFVVIVIISLLFVLALAVLFYTSLRYRALSRASDRDGEGQRGFHKALLGEFSAAYQKYGRDVNTPAIIGDVIGKKLGGLLLCERFLNNAVSLFVTLGLFGTFLGLSMSVSSLTELISYSNTEEWLSVLEASYVVFRLQPYYNNFGKRFIKSPKIYFTDLGLATHLLDIASPAQAARDPLMGGLFENMVVLEALKAQLSKGIPRFHYLYLEETADWQNQFVDAVKAFFG